MKPLFFGLFALALAILVGCDSGHSGPTNKEGGPGATASSSRSGPILGADDNAFKLSPPTLTTSLKQGEEKAFDIEITRGKGFDQDVSLSFENEDGKDLPKGLTFDPAKPEIKKSDKKVTVKAKAADDAAVNTFTIKVTGKPASGPSASHDFKIEVKKK
jgi:hypothetical protein